MNTLSNLGAGADQRVRVHQGPFINVSSDVDVHRRNADDALRYVGAFTDRGATRDESHARVCCQPPGWKGVLINEIDRGSLSEDLQHPDTETQQDAALHPLVRLPDAIFLGRSADLTTRQRLTELQKSRTGRLATEILGRSTGNLFDPLLKLVHEKR